MPQYAWVDTGPFLLQGEGKAACLLVHGFAGTPAEVRPLAERLAALGVTAYAPVLPGHASTSDALLRHSRHEWSRTVEDAWLWLKESHETVFVAGLSMGALITCKLAHQHTLDGIILMAPALVARDRRLRFAGALSFLADFVPEVPVPRGGLVDPRAWKQMWHYERRSLRALSQLYKLQFEARRVLPTIQIPTLIFHGLRDLTVPERSAREVFERLGTSDKELIWLEHSGHCLSADGEVDQVAQRIAEFISLKSTPQP